MTHIYADEKPSLEDIEHYGVKGMKWGQRKKTPLSVSGGKASRRPTKSEILGARAKERSLTDQAKSLDKKYGKDPATGKLAFSKEHEKVYKKLFEGDQRVIASYKTNGEKLAATLLLGPLGALQVSDRRVKSRLANRSFYRN